MDDKTTAPETNVEEIEARLWKAHGEEHAKLGAMLAGKSGTIETNWQGGKVNGLRTAIEVLRFINPSPQTREESNG